MTFKDISPGLSRTLSFNFQDFPGPTWFSTTFQVLQFSRKKSTTFQEVWEPRGECHIAGKPQTSWEHWKQNNLPLDDKVRQGAREKACGWSTRCLDKALTQTLSFDWLTIDWLDGWLFNTQINVSLTKLASHISPCQMYVQGGPKSGTLLVFEFPTLLYAL